MEERFIQRKADFQNAVLRLKEAIQEENVTDLVIDRVLWNI